MNDVKSCLIITMLLGVGYSGECEDYNEQYGADYNCDCNEDTWQEYYNSAGHNMEGCWLREADLSNAYLQQANLTEAMLNYANLQGADLWAAHLVLAHLNYANLQGASLYGTQLAAARLSWTNLCNLTGSPSGATCEESLTDSNGDGYDDVSYDAGAESGDLNLDGVDNVLDVVILVDNILNP